MRLNRTINAHLYKRTFEVFVKKKVVNDPKELRESVEVKLTGQPTS